ncbi:MAG: C4-type zinc ribbon domain-containing protein [Nannocystaceae bacterium]
MACKMAIPHQIYVLLRKGDDIPACESCGRLLYWSGHFPDETTAGKAEGAPKEAAPKARSAGATRHPQGRGASPPWRGAALSRRRRRAAARPAAEARATTPAPVRPRGPALPAVTRQRASGMRSHG